MRGFESAWLSTATDLVWADQQVPYDCPYAIDAGKRYVLNDLIAIGPRSWVYIGRDQKFSTEKFIARVVVKISRHAQGREAELSRQIEHPDIPAILDEGVTDLGHSYVVLEWIDGQGLDRLPVPWETARAVTFITRLGRIIEAAHARGIVHCDLKPDNVRVGPEERPILIDFDLAASSDQAIATPSRGNLGFMAPEQHRGGVDAITPQADVYGLGGLLIFLLTGEPVNGTTVSDATRNLTAERQWNSRLADSDLAAIVRRAVAPRRPDRYASVSAFVTDLDRWSGRLPIEWQKPGTARRAFLWVRRRPMIALTSALCFVLVIAGISYAFSWSRLKSRLEMEAFRENAEREAIALREVNAKTQAELDRLRSIGRNQLRTFALAAFSKPAEGQGEQYLPMLTWLNAVSQQPFFLGEGAPPLLTERIAAVRRIEQRSLALRQNDSYTLLLTRLTLAELLIRDNQAREARDLLDQVIAQWSLRLTPDEPVAAIMLALHATAKQRSGIKLNEKELNELRQKLEEVDAPRTYLELLDQSVTIVP